MDLKPLHTPIEDKWNYFHIVYRPNGWRNFIEHLDTINDMQHWCMREVKGLWTYRVLTYNRAAFLFTDEKDCIMFVLSWS